MISESFDQLVLYKHTGHEDAALHVHCSCLVSSWSQLVYLMVRPPDCLIVCNIFKDETRLYQLGLYKFCSMTQALSVAYSFLKDVIKSM